MRLNITLLILLVHLGISASSKEVKEVKKSRDVLPVAGERKQHPPFLKNLRRRRKKAQAVGVILRFKRWPNRTEEKLLLGKLKSHGLPRGKKNSLFKMWMPTWLESSSTAKTKKYIAKPLKVADAVCQELEKLSIQALEYCEPNFVSEPTTNETPNPYPCEGIPEAAPELEGIENALKEASPEKCSPLVDILDNEEMKGLSKYWAQELIGSDLIREELVKVEPPQSLSILVADIFSEYDNDLGSIGNHGILVKNIISNDGTHAILPELPKEKIMERHHMGISSDYLSMALEFNTDKPALINQSVAWGAFEHKKSRQMSKFILDVVEFMSVPLSESSKKYRKITKVSVIYNP